MKCNRCGFDGDGFRRVSDTPVLHLCPDCGSADVEGGGDA